MVEGTYWCYRKQCNPDEVPSYALDFRTPFRPCDPPVTFGVHPCDPPVTRCDPPVTPL